MFKVYGFALGSLKLKDFLLACQDSWCAERDTLW